MKSRPQATLASSMPEREDVRQLVVVADRVFPGAVVRQENRLGDVATGRADAEIGNGQRGLINIRRAPRFAHHFHRAADGRLEGLHLAGVLLRRIDLGRSKHQAGPAR